MVSKTFTTAETMLNARTLRDWLLAGVRGDSDCVAASDVIRAHVCAVSAAVPAAVAFGVDPANVFGFWDWVGGRYRCSF